MTTIFMDESGYTCSNLLDPVQPTFTLATLKCSEQEAQDFKAKFFSGVNFAELKHSSMRRRPRQQQMIIEFIKELINISGLVKAKVVHKKYALYYRLIDTIVEPAAQKDGIDFYAGGRIILLTNAFFFDFPVAAGADFADNTLRLFQEMMSKLDMPSFYRLFLPIINDKNKQPYETMIQNWNNQPLDFFLWHLQKGYDNLGFELVKRVTTHMKALKMHPLDFGVPNALHLIENWRREISGPITLIRDNSSKITKSKDIWNTITEANLPAKTIDVGYDNITLTFPIGVEATNLEDSKDWAGLQLADLLAGAINQWARWVYNGRELNNNDDNYSKSLDEVIPSFSIMPFWPSHKTPSNTSENRHNSSTTDDDEYFAQILRKHYLEYYEEEAKRLETMRKLQELGCQFIYRL